MTADRITARVYALILAGDELPADIVRHAQTCPACAAAMEEARGLLSQLDDVSSSVAAGDIPDLRQILNTHSPGIPTWPRRVLLSGTIAATGLATLILAVLYAPLIGPTPSHQASPSATSSATERPQVSSTPSASQRQAPSVLTLEAVRMGPAVCANLAQGWAVDVPAGWWYSAGLDPCRHLDPARFELRVGGVARNTAITLNLSLYAIGTFDSVLSQEVLTLAGYPAVRYETSGDNSPENPNGGHTYQYVIQLGATPEAGPNFVATVSSASATDYPGAKVALDQLMITWRPLTSQLVMRLDFLGEVGGYRPSLDSTVTADGRVVWRDGKSGALLVRRLTPAGLADLRNRLRQTGLFAADANYWKEARPGVTPPARGQGAWSFSVLNDRGTLVHVVASAIDGDEADYWIITAQRKALDDLQQELLDPEAWLPAADWADPAREPYVSDLTTLVLFTEPDAGSAPGHDVAELGWPFADPEHFGVSADDPGVHKLGTVRCQVLPAQDAAIVVEHLRAVGALIVYPEAMGAQLAWSAGNGTVLVALDPVRPDGSPSCSQVHG